MASWVDVPQGCDFTLANLPYGVFTHKCSSNTTPSELRIGTAIGDYVLDLKGAVQEGLLGRLGFDVTTLEAQTLNQYAALGRNVHRRVRAFLQDLLQAETSRGSQLRDHAERRRRLLVPMADVTMHLPMAIGGYTDFFVGIYHSQNVGRGFPCPDFKLHFLIVFVVVVYGLYNTDNQKCARIFRPGQPLNPNYTSLPVAYTGRASSVVVSGAEFHRPYGQYITAGQPTFAPSQKIDFEVEFGAFIAQGNAFSEPIEVHQAEDQIFGFVLLNDWSARDIQRWEAQPLGPFNGKSFCTTVSPWIVTPDALEPYKTEPVKTGTKTLPYLSEKSRETVYNIPIDASIICTSFISVSFFPPCLLFHFSDLTAHGNRYHVSRCDTRNVIFSFAQMIAHHTAGGCPLRTGDLIATGTLSGPSQEELGSLLEATEDGTRPFEAHAVASAAETPRRPIQRRYLEDGDEVEFRVSIDALQGANNGGVSGRVGFGSCRGKILTARCSRN